MENGDLNWIANFIWGIAEDVLRWPPTLTTMDVLFLIPVPWLAPVWVPLGISTATIVAIGVWERTHHREH